MTVSEFLVECVCVCVFGFVCVTIHSTFARECVDNFPFIRTTRAVSYLHSRTHFLAPSYPHKSCVYTTYSVHIGAHFLLDHSIYILYYMLYNAFALYVFDELLWQRNTICVIIFNRIHAGKGLCTLPLLRLRLKHTAHVYIHAPSHIAT